MHINRPSWDTTWLQIATIMADRSTCPRSNVGAVIVSGDNVLLGIGYNGAPKGMPHCTDVGCDKSNHNGCRRAIHAEVNAIMHAGYIPVNECTLYTTLSPCHSCALLMVQKNIRRVVYARAYRDTEPLDMLRDANVQTVQGCTESHVRGFTGGAVSLDLDAISRGLKCPTGLPEDTQWEFDGMAVSPYGDTLAANATTTNQKVPVQGDSAVKVSLDLAGVFDPLERLRTLEAWKRQTLAYVQSKESDWQRHIPQRQEIVNR